LALRELRAVETHIPEDASAEDLLEIRRDAFPEVKRRFLNGLGIFEKDVWEWSLFRELATLPELEWVAVAHNKDLKEQHKNGTLREVSQRYPTQTRQRIMTVSDGASQDTSGRLGLGSPSQQFGATDQRVGDGSEMTFLQQQQQQVLQQQQEHQQVRQQQLDQQHRLQQLQQEKSLADQAGATGILKKDA
jgi:hypothetical protein